MKTLLIFICSILISVQVLGQELSLQAGKSISKIVFKDQYGNKLQNLQSVDNLFFSVGYRTNFLKKERLFADLGLAYNRYGSTGSDPAVDNFFSWDVSYLGVNLGLDYEFYRRGNFTVYGKGMVSPEFLLRGHQTLDNQVYNLVGEDDFDTPFLFLRLGLGVQYRLSQQISIYSQYTGGKSYALKGDSEKLNFVAHNIGFGLLIDLTKGAFDKASPASEERLRKLEQKLEDQSQKIQQLEAQDQQSDEQLELQVQAKEAEMEALKDNISKALFDVIPQGPQVFREEGKVYVIMDNDLLFDPGSWEVSEQGEEAVEVLGQVLAENPQSSILIEGHTDNQPFRGAGNIRNNWDLSLKRATAIVEILSRNADLDPKRLIAAGRGEHYPKASNETSEGRAMNRRTEIIINPLLDKAYQLLED